MTLTEFCWVFGISGLVLVFVLWALPAIIG